MKTLAVIANYGRKNIQYLQQVYKALVNFADVIIYTSEYLPEFPRDNQNIVYLQNYQYLPYMTRIAFGVYRYEYEYFIYTENDILIRKPHLDAFIAANAVTPDYIIPGFLRYETGNNIKAYPELHKKYKWDENFMLKYGEYRFVYCFNDHAGMFMLTKTQLHDLIDNYSFLEHGKYGFHDPVYQKNTPKVHHCTSLYTHSPYRRAIPVSHLDAFSIHHLSNKYIERGYWTLKNEQMLFFNLKKISTMEETLNHTIIIQDIIAKYGYKNYLEIGAYKNKNYNRIKVSGTKVGVDPEQGGNVRKTSNQFFDDNNQKFDLIFIDGYHEEEQALKDIYNALEALNDNGIIVIHDLLPQSEEMQRVPRKTKEWTGNVWKAWARLRSYRDDLIMFVVDTDYGVGIIYPGKQETIGIPDDLSYDFFQEHRDELMNTMSKENYMEWIKS
ncbi:MAG: class I SAM-dependent methyltransferase [Bacteroidales bacterium]|nr:class I SAM-dependent methyltransferase [Bacteroidales bacterium]